MKNIFVTNFITDTSEAARIINLTEVASYKTSYKN